jgi:HEAT repeat protein
VEAAILTARQRRGAKYLALGLTQVVAANRLGMNPRTLRRWRTDVPGFAELEAELRAAGADEDATDVLRDCLYSKDERVRIQAAMALLKIGGKQADEAEHAAALEEWS